ncbi:TetR/AcrR family transcriptional regulator [Gordonia araii]|nr:TetR/AcrR family transcriptional regulator [Gordonia araii]NNG97015.1 TetR/AcrR family transcriptional regulator [Gordonia araii NBRC 100433]
MSTARKHPSQQRSREMVEWIVEAAARVFEREGIDATTNRIAEEAGVSIGSLYQYFPDKHALLDELAMRHIDEAEAALVSVWGDTDNGGDDRDVRGLVERLVAETARLHEDDGPLHRVMRVHAGRSAEVADAFARVVADLTDRVEKALADREIDDADGRARLIVATIDAQVHGVLAGGDAERRADRLRLVVDQVMAVVDG